MRKNNRTMRFDTVTDKTAQTLLYAVSEGINHQINEIDDIGHQ